jgi:hypothetical protein
MWKHLILCLGAIVPLLACSEGPATPEPVAAALGTYTLVQLDGAPLPAFLLEDRRGRFEVLNGSIILRSDGSYRVDESYSFTPVTGVPEPSSAFELGTFSIVGESVEFKVGGGVGAAVMRSGTWRGDTLLYDRDGIILRYQR